MSTFDEAYYMARAEEDREHNDWVFDMASTLIGLSHLLRRRDHIIPRVHGNGFIQVDLAPYVRLHVWGPGIPRQAVPTPIHDHVLGFRSRCITGRLLNVRYDILPGITSPYASHRVYRAQVRTGEDTALVPDEKTVLLMPAEATVIRGGESYKEKPGDIHQSIADCRAATVIYKDNLTLAQGGASPRIFVPLGTEPDNSFRRDAHPADFLWRIIDEVF